VLVFFVGFLWAFFFSMFSPFFFVINNSGFLGRSMFRTSFDFDPFFSVWEKKYPKKKKSKKNIYLFYVFNSVKLACLIRTCVYFLYMFFFRFLYWQNDENKLFRFTLEIKKKETKQTKKNIWEIQIKTREKTLSRLGWLISFNQTGNTHPTSKLTPKNSENYGNFCAFLRRKIRRTKMLENEKILDLG